MNVRSWAGLAAALGLAAAVALGTVGAAAAVPPSGAGDPSLVDLREQSRPTPQADGPGTGDDGTGDPVTEVPDPRVVNPRPIPVDPDAGGGDPPADGPGVDPAAPNDDQVGPHASAPTANLRTLANAIVVTQRTNSIWFEVDAPAGLGVGPIEISVGWGGERFTGFYDDTRVTAYRFAFPPLTGAPRQEYISVSLLERVPGGPYAYGIVKPVTVVPLFDVFVSNLHMDVEGSCDLVGSADPMVFWMDPDGVQRRDYPRSYDDDSPQSEFGYVPGFAATFDNVTVGRGLTRPTLEWVDEDPGEVGENALPRGSALLPFNVSYPEVDRLLPPIVEEVTLQLPDAGGDDCSALLSYTISYRLEQGLNASA